MKINTIYTVIHDNIFYSFSFCNETLLANKIESNFVTLHYELLSIACPLVLNEHIISNKSEGHSEDLDGDRAMCIDQAK